MKNTIKVYSHVRSGTHFLMSILYKNFYSNLDLKKEASAVGHWSGKLHSQEVSVGIDGENELLWGGLFGRHNFGPLDKPNVIYIYRDGRNVMQSMYNFEKKLLGEKFNKTFSEYITTPLDWYEAPSQSAGPKYTPVEHWYLSTKLWIESDSYKIRYEDLHSKPEESIMLISKHFNIKPSGEIYLGENYVGIAPNIKNKDKERPYLQYFSSKDFEYFNSIVPHEYPGLFFK